MRLKSVLSALGIAIAIVIALDYASFAATGHSALLGKLNKANKVTTFQRTNNGPAVGFTTKSGQPPFTVNRATRVTNLNADLLDGRSSESFATNNPTKVYKFQATTPSTSHTFNLSIPGPGEYLVTYSVPTTLSSTTTTNAWAWCDFGQSAGIFSNFQASGYTSTASVFSPGPTGGPTMGLSATTVINPAGYGSSFNVFCNASDNWTTPPTVSFLGTSFFQPATITVTKLSNSTTTTGSARQVSPQQEKLQQQRARGSAN